MRENLFAQGQFLDVQSLSLLGGFLPIVIRFLYFHRMRENLTFLPFACFPFLVVVHILSTSEDTREMKATNFGGNISVLILSITLQVILNDLVEIYFYLMILAIALALFSVVSFGEPRPLPESVHEKRVIDWLQKMVQKLGVDSTNFSSFVVAVLLVSLFVSLPSRGQVQEASVISICFRLCSVVIIALFSRLPSVRKGWQHRPRVLCCLSAFFLAFTLLVFLRPVCLHLLDLVEFPESFVICFAIIILLLSLHFFNQIIFISENSQGSKNVQKRKRQRNNKKTRKKVETKKLGQVKSGAANSSALVVLSSSTGESQLVIETSKAQDTVEEDESQNDCVPYEMPSEVVTTIDDTDTLESQQINMFSEIATSSCVSSGGKNIVEEGEKMEISSEAEPVPTNIASDIEGRYMSNCTLYCSLFPIDYEFTRDTLVWSWIAAGIINNMQKDEMEKVAFRCFDELIKSKFILPSSYDRLSDQMRYKLGKDDHVSFTNEKYRKKLDSDDNLIDLEHLSLIFQEIDELQLENLRNCSNLKTLLLHKCYGSKIENILNHLFLVPKSVTLIDLSCTNTVELPSSIENLEALMYLNLSQTPIRLLPESIGSLGKLETLILLGCQSLSGLPKGICKLTNLQHLELDIALQLQSMPTGIGNLTNLETLRTFVVGRKDDNGITELRSMNKLEGSLCIFKLENIPNKEEARKARLCDKEYLTKIEYLWSDLEDDKVTIEEGILENLQPHYGLHEVKIVFYSGGVLPSWVSDPSFNQMVNITLSGCRYCERLPTLGELPSLKILSVVDMDSVVYIDFSFCRKRSNQDHQHAFPQLEKLSFDGMSSLESWTGVEDGDFPCLRHLEIKSCPKLISLQSLSHLKSLELLKISNCPELPCLPEGSVKCHTVKNCPKLRI